ncbi:unnamed protein product [Phytophthora fragariaefolia]|uniref:Unnamed protein product n=1 Tax=Phytophthora fragariaefolia TaxID=1490495 RepID=A0A9W7CG54_9STRA|nr:unnamed protein product [Phytophthora fragariaefolia]
MTSGLLVRKWAMFMRPAELNLKHTTNAIKCTATLPDVVITEPLVDSIDHEDLRFFPRRHGTTIESVLNYEHDNNQYLHEGTTDQSEDTSRMPAKTTFAFSSFRCRSSARLQVSADWLKSVRCEPVIPIWRCGLSAVRHLGLQTVHMGRKLWTNSEVHLLLDYLGQDLAAYTAGVNERFYANDKLHLEAADYTKSASQIKTKLGELERSHKAYKLSSALYRANASK